MVCKTPLPDLEVFSEHRFIDDLKRVCDVVGAEFSQTNTEKILQVYKASFHRGAVLWRITDRPGDAVNYRFYERMSTDTIQPAIEAMLLDSQNPMIPLVKSWSSLYHGTPQQSCDFDAQKGLVKVWIYLGGMRPLDEILDASHVPETIRQHRHTFHNLNLKLVRHVAADYFAYAVNLYFRAPGPLSFEQLTHYAAMVNSSGVSRVEFEEMAGLLNPAGFTFSVTIDSLTGSIQRVAIYALKLPPGVFPSINRRLAKFFKEAPSYDREDFNAIAWSLGNGSSSYIKAERSHSGELVRLTKDWNSALSS